MITLLQVNYSEDISDTYRDLTWGSRDEEKSGFDPFLNLVNKGLNQNAYKKVAEIDTDSLGDAFRIGNIGDEIGEGHLIKRLKRMHSISIGDILVKEAKSYVVDKYGFTELGGGDAEIK
jgi:hypothetical protein